MIAIQCRMDESFDKRIYSVGAVFAKDLGWQCLEDEWAAILKLEGLKYFRTSECLSVSGEFRKFRKQPRLTDVERRESCKVMNDLVRAVDRKVTIVGFSVDMQAFHDVANTPKKREEFGGTPYYFCYYHAMAMCAEIIRNTPYQMVFGYDEHQQYGQLLKDAYSEFKKRSPEFAPHMSTLTAFNDKHFIPIQVADLAASVVRRYTAWKISKPRPKLPIEYRVLKKKNRIARIRVCLEPQLRGFLGGPGL